jgi:hypothetical protein
VLRAVAGLGAFTQSHSQWPRQSIPVNLTCPACLLLPGYRAPGVHVCRSAAPRTARWCMGYTNTCSADRQSFTVDGSVTSHKSQALLGLDPIAEALRWRLSLTFPHSCAANYKWLVAGAPSTRCAAVLHRRVNNRRSFSCPRAAAQSLCAPIHPPAHLSRLA